EDRDGAGDAPAGRRCAGAGGRAEVFALVTATHQPAGHEHGGEPGRDRANPTCTHSPPQLARALCTAAGVARSTTTVVDLITATATDPTCRSSSSTASRLISDTTRNGPAWMSTCAITVSLTMAVMTPRSRLR